MQEDHPVFGRGPRVVARVDELAERQEPDLRAVHVTAPGVGDLGEHLAGTERHLRPHVRQPPVAWHEDQLVAGQPLDAEHPDADPVLEVLIAELVRDRAVIAHGPDGVVLPDWGDQPALGGDGGDPAEHRLVLVLKLHEHELAVHGDRLKFIPIGEHQVGVELHPAVGEAAEDPDNVFLVE